MVLPRVDSSGASMVQSVMSTRVHEWNLKVWIRDQEDSADGQKFLFLRRLNCRMRYAAGLWGFNSRNWFEELRDLAVNFLAAERVVRHTGTMRRGVSLRGVSGSSILMSPRWRVLGPEGNAGLRTAISFIGAGTLGAILIFKCAPKLILGRSLNSVSKIGATSSSPVEKMWTVPGLQNTGNNCFLNVILQVFSLPSIFDAPS